SLTPGDLTTISGDGKLSAKLSDPTVLAAALGVTGIDTPPLGGSANLTFNPQAVSLGDLTGQSGSTGFSGKLALNRTEQGAAVTGNLTLDRMDVAGLVGATAGG